MKKQLVLNVFLLFCSFFATFEGIGQTLPGTYKTSWVGNTFGEGLACDRTCGRWVQNDVLAATISPTGTIYTNSEWDEGGRQAGIYTYNNVIGNLSTGEYIPNVGKVGKEYSAKGFAVAVNTNNAFATMGGSIYKYNLNGSGGVSFATCKAYGLSANSSVLAASDNESNLVRLYNTSGGQIRQWSVTKPGAIAVAPNGDIWVVTCTGRGGDVDKKYWTFNQGGITKIQHYSSTGSFINEISDPQGTNSWLPTSLAFHSDGRLMIGDAGMRSQILLYNVSGTPTLNATFGDYGGIGSGTPGQATPKKFWGITGVGCTSDGKIMVAMYERGSAIRTFDANGNMIGALYGLHFADNMDVDPASDGTELYGINERISLDLSKSAGAEWSLTGITYHKNAYPTDPRGTRNVLDMASTFMRRVNGNLIMYATGMYAGTLDIYKFQNDLAIFCQTISLGTSAYEPDTDGNIWYVANNTIKKIPLTGFSAGTPTFGASQDIAPNPGGISTIERIYYNKAKDEMYFTGETPAGDWGVIGAKIAKYTNWSTSRTLAWKRDLPYGPGTPGTNRQKAISFTDDYFFTVGVVVRCLVNVFRTSDGLKAGEMIPGPEVNGLDATGWVDIPYGIRSFKRSTGEYLVLVEEDGYGKTLMFRWSPSGCTASIPFVPSNLSASSISASQINLTWSDTSGNEDGFRVERKTGSGGTYSEIATVGSNITSYSNIGLAASTQYYYRVRSYNCAGSSNYTAEANATTQASGGSAVKLTGTQFDNITPYSAGTDGDKGFDSNTNSFVDAASASGAYTGLDFGSTKSITSIKYYPRANWAARMNGGKFQGSSDGVNYTDVYTISTTPSYSWTTISVSGSFRYMRYLSAANGYCNVAEIEFWGDSGTTIGVTGVSMNPTTANVVAGATQQLTATVSPANATNKNVSWTSGATSVATVNASGLVTAVSAGTAVITVTTQDGNFSATCSITVTAANVTVTGVTVSPTAASLAIGGTQLLTATVAPSNATNKNVTWSSNATGVATVNSSGMVTAVAPGTAIITVTTVDQAKTATATITVQSPCTDSKLTGAQADNIDPNMAGSDGNIAFDGNTSTFVDAKAASGAYTQLDFGTAKNIKSIKFYPRASWAARMNGGKFQGSNDGTSFTDVYTITTTPAYAWNTVNINVSYRYMRYLSPSNGYCNVAEIEYWGGCAVSGASASDVIVVDEPSTEIAVYPNPADNGTFTIILPFKGESVVRVYSLSGVLVYEETSSDDVHEIPLQTLSQGWYIIRITHAGRTFSEKVFLK